MVDLKQYNNQECDANIGTNTMLQQQQNDISTLAVCIPEYLNRFPCR